MYQMACPAVQDVQKFGGENSFITKLNLSISNGLPHSIPLSNLKTDEHELVRAVLQMLQGFCSNFFYWDLKLNSFLSKEGIYASHLSQTGLEGLLNPFSLASTCLKRVEMFVKKAESFSQKYPTLSAFANSVHSWLKRLRDIALKEEESLFKSNNPKITTLLDLINSLSSLFAGAEHLYQVINEAVPTEFLNSDKNIISLTAAELAVQILNCLFTKLTQVCLVRDGEGDPYKMLIYLFIGSLLPYIQTLDSWLYDGILYDPYEEMFFYANSSVSIDQPSFWETSYLLRQKPSNNAKITICPLFFHKIAKAIISAGKSLQLVQHIQDQNFVSTQTNKNIDFEIRNSNNNARVLGILTLSDVFLISLVGLFHDSAHIFDHLLKYPIEINNTDNNNDNNHDNNNNNKIWLNFLSDAIQGRRKTKTLNSTDFDALCTGYPNITVCKEILQKSPSTWEELNVSRSFRLPPLNDDTLREAVFGCTDHDAKSRVSDGTDFQLGFLFDEFEMFRLENDRKALESLCAFPTLLPSFPEDKHLSEILPFQKDSTLASKILKFIQNTKLKNSLDPQVVIQECLGACIKRQVDHVGKNILNKLMGEWRLIDELFILRSIYLLGSGDLLQQFLLIIFNRLDKGDSWDDDFELNSILQDSIRNSSDRSLLSAPDSLTVTILNENLNEETDKNLNEQNSESNNFGIDAFDKLNFTYKVSWPLDLIANREALKKYNQVMGFLLKVKRAKFVLDKTRKWRWKGRINAQQNHKHHLLIEQKLLNFVDAFHQYVMDQVYHSAWRELCSGLEASSSLDEVIDVHETYLSSIQRQCFVASDKLMALIASRIKTILGLALDFYNVKRTLRTGGTTQAIKARCETEINRIEKQFDDCVAFLLKILSFKLNVGHFPHLGDLVTRINYNYFYMSVSGNLLNVPKFEGKTKTPAFRPA